MALNATVAVFSTTTPVTGYSYGATFNANQMIQGSVQLSITQSSTGVAEGTFIIEASNDLPQTLQTDSTGQYIPVNWAAVSSVSVSATGNYCDNILLAQMSYRFIRMAWDHTSDTDASGTITANLTYFSA